MSKLVTAFATVMAVEEGAFELDDAVPAALVPEFEVSPTIRELLAHASGMAFDNRTPQRPPKDRRIYSSAGYEVLADAIEHATDIPFTDYVRLGIGEPLGLSPTHDLQIEGSAGHGFRATTQAMAAVAAQFLNPTLVDPSTIAQAMQVQYPLLAGIVPGYGRFSPCPWGLGFEIHGEKHPHWLPPTMPGTACGHFGQAGTFLWVEPTTNRAAVVLTDRAFGPWAKPLWSDFNQQLWDSLGG